jgi:hypothetical protein
MNSSLMLTNWGKKLGKRLMKPRLKPAPEKEPQRWNIVRGDKVQVIQGPQTGQKGKVLAILRDSCRVIVEGVNLVRYLCVLPSLLVLTALLMRNRCDRGVETCGQRPMGRLERKS